MWNVLQFSADHHAGWPLCKLWEHRFSVPDLVSPPRPPPRRILCGKFCFSGRLRPTGAADPGLRCRVLKVPGCWSCPKDQGNDCNACSSEDLTVSCMAASWAMVKGPAWTRSGKSSEENSSMISSRSPRDATLEESSPGSPIFACSVVDSAGAAVNVALTGRLVGAKRFLRARPACGFEVEQGCFVPVAKLTREMRAALPPVIGRLSAWRRRRRTSVESEAKSFCFEGGHWKLAYADEPLTSTRTTS